MARLWKKKKRLKKELRLFDVFAISTGAMFSSGFFLLPGLAAVKTGPSVVLAYLAASVLILPALFSIAELSTAMPKAGGSYFFLDRSMGARIGTISGLGTYLILILKTAFALIGIGAYTAIFLDVPIRAVAIGLTVVFMLLNIVGTKETAGLQRFFVVTLIAIIGLFIVQGLNEFFANEPGEVIKTQFTPFTNNGWEGFVSTIGFVFVSYIGLTKVASVAEEVKHPEKNIPLGMILSVVVTTFIYVAGVFVIVALMEPAQLHSTLTPVTDTAKTFTGSVPTSVNVALVMIAAIAAFASTGNAGLLSASRFPLAMARDHILPRKFLTLNRFRTPSFAIIVSSLFIVAIILLVREEAIAKLASAFQLFVFVLINFAVIVMRESRIVSYDPGFRSPLYPWVQLFGIASSLVLIAMMGIMPVLFTVFIILFGSLWYKYYVEPRVRREGAIYHWFAHLGTRRYENLDIELRGILREKGLRESDPFDVIVARAVTMDTDSSVVTFEEAIRSVSKPFSKNLPISAEQFVTEIMQGTQIGATPVIQGVALPHLHIPDMKHPEMALVRSRQGVELGFGSLLRPDMDDTAIHAIIVLISPEQDPKQHLRILGQIAERVDSPDFMKEWLSAPNDKALQETLLSGKTFFTLHVNQDLPAGVLAGKSLREIKFPEGTLVALIQRGRQIITPRGDIVLKDQDRLTIIGDLYDTMKTINQAHENTDG